ncbi:MAG: Hsp70 family protein [Deltaproteobacteria bacterium]|jgi:molecular chaperone DnaK (HSP70)|nr:Hsp70 family protein [Deltaproteobacteria bacterium]
MPLHLGIDLGTTNTTLASAKAVPSGEVAPPPENFPILQLVRPGDRLARPTLPSCLYLAAAGELPAGSLDLPWAQGRSYFVGEGAKERGAEVPLHLVSSSKSWLCHGGVDRRAAILPAGAPDGLEKVSPVTAAVRVLEHLRDAWNAEHPKEVLEAQDVLLTVPASFDAVAKDLTLEAARAAGLSQVTLLEEPQAAFYAWLAVQGEAWRKVLKPGSRVLVADVGGGTSDFTLIEVKDDGRGNLSLERVAVGEHLLLGGDNMDLALAHHLMSGLLASGKKLDAGQQRALVLAARRAKEQLLSDPSLTTAPITVLGRGSKLIGGQLKAELLRADLERILVEGFFPVVANDARPVEARRTGFMELGLPYVADPAITRHLAKFLSTHLGDGGLPTHLLFNGGVFNSPLLRERLLSVLEGWGLRPEVLTGSDNDLAVARGAAHYARVRAQGGLRIRGGVARSYYVGIEGAAPAIPGVPPPLRALCVVPFGMEEGTQADVPSGELGLVVGEEVGFRFLSSTERKNDAIGTMLDEFTWPEFLVETAPIHLKLEAKELAPGTLVPVHLQVKLTEIGTLEVWSVAKDGQRWRLEHNVREER